MMSQFVPSHHYSTIYWRETNNAGGLCGYNEEDLIEVASNNICTAE
jgi:hypothetical protein